MTEAGHTQQRAARWLFALTAALLLLGRCWYLAHFAGSVPFWDQWDAEGWNLIRPWTLGELGWADLVAAHNEHRIVWTRLAMLGLYIANGEQWDNLVEVFFCAPLFAATMALTGLVATRVPPRLDPRWVWPVVLFIGFLPVAWENFLVGLQLPFDLMVLAAMAGIWVCSGTPGRRAPLLVLLIVVFAFGTLASGVLLLPALAWVLFLRTRQHAVRLTMMAGVLVALAALGVVGVMLVHHVAGHDAMRAQNPADFLHAFGLCASWPLSLGWPAALVLWLPWLWLQRELWTKPPQRGDLFFAGLGAWALTQCAAIALARGHELSWLSSRYTAVTLIQTMVALYAAARMWRGDAVAAPIPHRAVAVLAAVGIAAGLVLQGVAGFYGMHGRHAATQIETQVVHDYIASGDASLLRNRPPLHVPYPDPQRLQQMLDDPVLRRSLAEAATTETPPLHSARNGLFVPGGLSRAVRWLLAHATLLLALSGAAWLWAWLQIVFARAHRTSNPSA